LMYFQICGIPIAMLEMEDLHTLPNCIFHAKNRGIVHIVLSIIPLLYDRIPFFKTVSAQF